MQQPVKVQGQVVDICSCHVLRGPVRGEEGQASEYDYCLPLLTTGKKYRVVCRVF